MKRGKPLRADPEKVREFLQRGRGSLKADPAKTRAFVDRGRVAGARVLRESAIAGMREEKALRRSEGPLSPADWRKAVAGASGLKCIVSGTRADDWTDPDFEAHHPLAKGELRARELRAFVWDKRNGVWLTELVHATHEHSERVVFRDVLPDSVWEFCAEMDALGSGSWATAWVENKHPIRKGRC